MASRAKELSDLGNSGHLNVHDNGTVTLEGGNVGIGTDNPDRKLHVKSTSSSVVKFETSGSSYAGVELKNISGVADGSAAGYLYGYNSSQFLGGIKFVKKDSNSGQIVLRQQVNSTNTDVVNISDGNVGIGNVLPAHPIHIYEDGGYYASIGRGNSTPGGSDPWLGLFNNTDIANATFGWGIYDSNANGSFQIWNKNNNTTGYDALTILRGGNVGIGTNSPNSVTNYKTLHIDGTVGSLIDMGASNLESRIVADTNGLGFQVTPGSHTHQNIRWKAGQISGAVDSHMILLANGNVGIGTNNPSHKLEVFGTAADGTELLHISSNGDVPDGGYHWMTSAIAGSQTTNANIVHMIGKELASKNSGYFGFHYAGDHSDDNFITIGGYAADQLLNIKMNGNVGIGTTNPDYTLVVGNNSTYHTLKVQGINANLAATVKFKHHGGGSRSGIDPEWNISRGSNETSFNTGVTSGNALVGGLAFWNNTIGGGNVDAMRLKDNGDAILGYNVGIGTSTPSAKLHTRETTSNTISAATAGVKFDGSGGDGLAFGNMQSSPYSSWIQAGYLADGYSPAFNNGYPISLNPVGGNVGIGITSPTEKLHVAGVIRSEGYDTDSITSYNITGGYNAGTEYVFTTRADIAALGYGAGFYKFLVWSDTFNAGTSHYQCYTPYDEFYFNNYGSNTSTVQTINYGVSMGHAPNTATRAIDIRLRHKYGADATYPANPTFTFVPVNGFSGLNGNAGYHLRIYLFKVA